MFFFFFFFPSPFASLYWTPVSSGMFQNTHKHQMVCDRCCLFLFSASRGGRVGGTSMYRDKCWINVGTCSFT
ncbi:hypothetical protein V8C26DRAFT_385759 [Trichoderma gracile]